MRCTLSGVSSATRASTQSAIAIAVSLVLDAANLQPVLPVQATRPARMLEALRGEADRLQAALHDLGVALAATPEINRFCQTVRRISPSPSSCAMAASARICADRHAARPAAPHRPKHGPAASAHERRCGPAAAGGWARDHARAARAQAACRAWPSTAARNLSKPQASSTYFSRAFLRSVRSP